MARNSERRPTWLIWKPLSIGIVSTVLLVVILGIWGTKTSISGAVIGKGKVQVSSGRTALQHPVGGVVHDILADDGDSVAAGDVVLRLDDAPLRSELTIIEGELFETLANEARLEAEIDDRRELIPHPLLAQVSLENLEIKFLLERQQRRLTSFYQSLDAQWALIDEQIKQVEEQIVGVEAELAAKIQRSQVIGQELQQIQELSEKGLVKFSVIYTLQKDQLATQGDVGRLTARVAELKGKISELRLKLHTLAPAEKEKSVEELSKLRPGKTKLMENRSRIIDEMSKLEIRTPISGTIHDSQILGLRSVVGAAKPLMYIVPNDRPVSIAVRIDAADINQVYFGQTASLKFSAFNRRSTPTILGRVSNISADAFLDPTTRKLYYDVEVSLLEGEIDKLGENTLISGMPVDAFISTESRSPLNYITKPIMDYFDRAFRDA